MIEESEKRKPNQKNWISLGDRQFYIEDVKSIYVQANHLIINFDYTDKQIVIFFGHSEKGYKNAKKVFDILGDMFDAYAIPLPSDTISNPDILKTVYGQKIDKTIRDSVKYQNDKYKKRHQSKLKKALEEIDELKKKMDLQ